jgi:tetratricopeptide (TPR) repeat protein
MEEQPTRRDAPAVAVLAPTLRDFRPPQRPSAAGLRLVGGYEILEELGRGGMGVVYKARQVQLDRLVALKMLGSASASRDDLVRFRTEAEAVARLSHPNIVPIYEVGEHDGLPFFSLEYLEGGSLDRRLGGKPLAAADAAALVETLARAAHFAHQRGIVHRDLKPANVLLAASGPKITDFGLARRLDGSSRQTHAGEILGTPSYMAPEQAEGRVDAVGPHTDVWALGAILYECLAGSPPFDGPSVVETLQQVRRRDPAPLSGGAGHWWGGRRGAWVSRDLETICLKCLQKEPQRRYASALDLADDLRLFLGGRPIGARPVGWTERAAKWARRRPTCVALLGVTAVLVVVLAGLAVESAWRRAAAAAAVRQLRAGCEAELARGQEQLHSKEPEQVGEAVEKFAAVCKLLAAAPGRGEELRGLADRAAALHDRAKRALGAQARARAFLALRDEACFQLRRDLIPGEEGASPQQTERAARRALDSFPELGHLNRQDGRRLRLARQEVLFTLAEARARQGGAGNLRRALAALDRLDGGGDGPLRAVHRRRARYLEALGESLAAAGERHKADALPQRGALDWHFLGLERWEAGRRDAVACFDRAADEQPDLFWAQFFRALAHERLAHEGPVPDRPAHWAETRAALDACTRLRPGFIWPYLLRSHLHCRQGKYAAARADLDRAARLGPDAAARYVLHIQRGLAALGENEYALATAELQRAVKTLPRRYHAFANLAQAYWRRGWRQRGLAAIGHAIRLRPELAPLYRTRALMHQQNDDLPAALADLDRALACPGRGPPGAPQAADQRERAHLLFRLRRHGEALAACREVLRLRPDDRGALRLHAEVLLELGRHGEAVAAFDRYLEKGKPDAEVYRRRARARAAAGDVAGVVEDYTQALAYRRDAGLLAARGWAYLVTGAPRAALRDFEAAVALGPPTADALAGRATARVELGEVRAGVADAEAALRRGPADARLLYNVARVFGRASSASGRTRAAPTYRARALAALRDALAAMPADRRAAFWRDRVRRDSAFRPLHALPGFAGLDRQYAR